MNSMSGPAAVLVRLLLAIILIYICIVLQQLLVPLFFAVMFAYLLYPAAVRLERIGIPRVITNLVLIVSAMAAIAGFFYLAGHLFASVEGGLAEVREQFEENISYFRERLGEAFGFDEEQVQDAINGFDGAAEYIMSLFAATTNTVVALGLMPVYTFLLLLYRNKFRTFLDKLVSDDNRETAGNIVNRAAEVVPRYLKGLIIVVLILMVVNSTAFWLIGLDYPVVLGVIAALFNFIPYLGTIIGFAAVLLIVLATQSPALAIWVVVAFFPIQFFENNILTPNITGSYVQINPLIIILSLIAGGMMWGLAGMLLVIPYLGMLKIIFENIDHLNPYAYLIGTRGTEEHFPSIEKMKMRLRRLFGR
jgi:predicted PurR-regulated permease PerM